MTANIFEVLAVGFVLCADSFSAALAMGFRPHTQRDTFKFALLSGAIETFVAIVGVAFGKIVISQFSAYDHWISFILLSIVALHMYKEGWEDFKDSISELDEPKIEKKFHGLFKILIVSLATSLDALAVGVGLGAAGKTHWAYFVSIGLWAFSATLIGMAIARKVPAKLSAYFSFFGATILLGMGIHFLGSL